MKRIFFITIVLFALAGCKRHKKPTRATKILNFGTFTIETPLMWGRIKEDTASNNPNGIAIDNNDTLNFNYGTGSITPAEDSVKIIFEDNSVKGNVNVKWLEIDGHKAKIISPQQSGHGITGVYIDSLSVTNSGIARFYLYGNNLNPDNEEEVLKAIKSIKFSKE
jgi:hypothetical protein